MTVSVETNAKESGMMTWSKGNIVQRFLKRK